MTCSTCSAFQVDRFRLIEYFCGLFVQLLTQTGAAGFLRSIHGFITIPCGLVATRCQTHIHTHNFLGFWPMTKADTGFRELGEMFGNLSVEGEVESLAWCFSCMGNATVTIQTNTHANAPCVCMYLYVCACVFVCTVPKFSEESKKFKQK